jgi:predicted GTPase
MGQRVIILGAAGRDFHNFNVFFRDSPEYTVVAFTATQIPNIEGRRYPAELAGDHYPDGIPIFDESELEDLIQRERIELAVFSYSDVSYEHVMTLGSRVGVAGASFMLLAPGQTMLESSVPVVAVCAARTGCGKSQTSRKVAAVLKDAGKRVVLVRHPMPYGDLAKQAVQRFARVEDLVKHDCTIEEREEYEPIIVAGHVVYAGVDYEAILREAEKEADVVIWDGGNNDAPFFRPDLFITVVDPHRADHPKRYYPGGMNVRMADVVVINKIDTAAPEDVERAREVAYELNPEAVVVDAASPIYVDGGEQMRGKRVLVVEDGPTTTHGGMKKGAGTVAALKYGASEIVDPRPFAVNSIAATFEKYPDTGPILPAMGYGGAQTKDLALTIDRADVDLVVIGTPIDLRRVITIDKPTVRVRYELEEIGEPKLTGILRGFLDG